jgi:hypothetical protein
MDEHVDECQPCDVWKDSRPGFLDLVGNVCFKSGNSITSLTCLIEFHNDRLYGLGYKDRMDMFCAPKSSFKKATQNEIRWNGKYMDELKKRYNDENGNCD